MIRQHNRRRSWNCWRATVQFRRAEAKPVTMLDRKLWRELRDIHKMFAHSLGMVDLSRDSDEREQLQALGLIEWSMRVVRWVPTSRGCDALRTGNLAGGVKP